MSSCLHCRQSETRRAHDTSEPRQPSAPAGENGPALRFVFQLDEILLPMKSTIKGLLTAAGVGLDGLSHLKGLPKGIPGAYMHLDPAPEEAVAFEKASKDFVWWVLTRALSDAVEEVKPLLARASIASSLIRGAPHFRFSLDEFRTKLDNDDALEEEIANQAWPRIWNHLHEQYPDLGDPPLRGAVESLNTARNFLVHGGGVVRRRDVDRATGLFTLRWVRIVPWVRDANGEHEMNTDNEPVTGPEMVIVMKPTPTSREFREGETLEIDPQLLVEACYTILAFAGQVAASIAALWGKYGVPIHAGPVTKIVDWDQQVFRIATSSSADTPAVGQRQPGDAPDDSTEGASQPP